MYGDGGGLYLQVARGGSKSWIFRYRFKGHTSKAGKPVAREMGLGSVKCEGRIERGRLLKPVNGLACSASCSIWERTQSRLGKNGT
jgi:hypothetical protein